MNTNTPVESIDNYLRWAAHDVIGIYLTLKAIVYDSKNQVCNEVNTQQHVKHKKEAIPTRRPVKDNICQCNTCFRMLEKRLLKCILQLIVSMILIYLLYIIEIIIMI